MVLWKISSMNKIFWSKVAFLIMVTYYQCQSNFFVVMLQLGLFPKKINPCERCVVQGEYEGRVVFHESAYILLNDTDFSMGLYQEHQSGRSNLLDFEISCVKMLVLEPVTLVYLGAVRRTTSFWIEVLVFVAWAFNS